MNITIIGAGNMGRGIGTRAVAGGHSVTFIDRDPVEAEKAATDVKASANNGAKVSTASLGGAELGDVVDKLVVTSRPKAAATSGWARLP